MTISTNLQPLQGVQIGRLPFIRHGITRRVPGLGDADGNISYSEPRDPVDAWAMRQFWCERMGVDPNTLVTAHQVHGNAIGVVPQARAGTGSAPGTGLFGKFDSLVTNEPNVAVMMTHADCLAVILCDPQTRAVGVVHAGWRGTVVECHRRSSANDGRPIRIGTGGDSGLHRSGNLHGLLFRGRRGG